MYINAKKKINLISNKSRRYIEIYPSTSKNDLKNLCNLFLVFFFHSLIHTHKYQEISLFLFNLKLRILNRRSKIESKHIFLEIRNHMRARSRNKNPVKNSSISKSRSLRILSYTHTHKWYKKSIMRYAAILV